MPVLSTNANAKIISIDCESALKVPGVIGKIDHTDVKGDNNVSKFF